MERPVGYRAESPEWGNLFWFVVIAFGWTWVWWWVLFLSGWVTVPEGVGTSQLDAGASDALLLVLVALSPFGPTIAGFVLTAIHEGRSGVRALWKRFWNLDLRLGWLLVVLLFWPGLRLLTNVVGRMSEEGDFAWLTHPGEVWVFLPVLAVSTLVNGGMSEEFGWRGYALPRLQSRFGALSASVLLGLVEGLWHYPLMVIGTWWQDSVPLLLYWFVLTAIARTWVFNNTGGSLLAALLFHGMGNTASDIVWCCPSPDVIYWVFGAVIVGIVVVFGPRDLVRGAPARDREHGTTPHRR